MTDKIKVDKNTIPKYVKDVTIDGVLKEEPLSVKEYLELILMKLEELSK